MSQAVVDALVARFPEAIMASGSQVGDEWAAVRASGLREVCSFLRDDPAMDFALPIDLTAVDFSQWEGGREPRFDVVYHLCSVRHHHRIRLKVAVSEDHLVVPSVADLYPGLNWFERETWDMFGIRFEGHPDPRRVLLYEEFEGHPLRKDHPHAKAQPRVPMRELPDADIHDPPLGPAARPKPPGAGPDWTGGEGVAPAKLNPSLAGMPDEPFSAPPGPSEE
jgi:NADH-quinone oxidoreductase subunit C